MFESIRNYYEVLVIERVLETLGAAEQAHDEDYLEDIVCMALNQLPTRYARHSVDLAFYMTAQERAKMDSAVDAAIANAVRRMAQEDSQIQSDSLTD